jgi:preprotein translocase subunit SecD
MRNSIICPSLAIGLMLVSLGCFSSVHSGSELTFQVIQEQVIFNGSSFESAAVIEQRDKTYGLEVKLTPSAASELARLSSAGIGKTMNIVLNGKIISASTIQSQLGGNFLVTGLSKDEAEKIARSVK